MLDRRKENNKGELQTTILPRHERPMLPPAPPIPPPGKLAAPGSPAEKARAAKEQEEFDKEAIRQLEKQPKAGEKPAVAPLPQPPAGSQGGAMAHPDGEPPYATEPPGVLMPQQVPQSPQPPPEGGKK